MILISANTNEPITDNVDYQIQVVSANFPTERGYVAAYYPVVLRSGRPTTIRVKCLVWNEGTLSFNLNLPPSGEAIPLTESATGEMSLYVDPGSVTVSDVADQAFVSKHMSYAPHPQNYGDQVIVVVRNVPWDTRMDSAPNSKTAEHATVLLRTEMEKFTVTVETI